MKTHRFTPFLFPEKDNEFKNIFDSKLIRLITIIGIFIFFGSEIIKAQCPVTDCLPLHVTQVNLETVPECGVSTVSLQGDIQNGQTDCKNGPLNNCHEFVMFRPVGSVTQQFTLEVGQGAGCNGELDATYSFIDGVCDTLSNGGSNTSITFSFPSNVDTITLFLCLNSGAFVTICDLCVSPPPCDLLPICNLDPIDTTGCSVPAPFTDPADVFTNIPTCTGTTLILDHEDVGDTSFCMLPAGVDFIRTYTLYFLDAIGDTIEFRECPQSIKIIPVLPTVQCQDITVNLNNMGMVSITSQQVLDSSALGCGGTFSINPSSFTCANLGANTVTLTVTDDCGNTATCTATVTVQTPTPTADAGAASAEICITETFTATASASNGSILWSTSGTGSFNGTQITEDATYTPSMADYTAGTVTLTLTVTGICTSAVDSIVLNFIQCECEVVLVCDEDVLRADSIINGCSAASAPPIISPANSVFDTMSIGGIDCNILYSSTTNTTGTLCPAGITVTYTYYGWHDDDLDGIRDPEEQQYSCAEVFTIVDVTAPDISCPASLTIQCNTSTLPADTGTATATDNCDTTPTITSSDVTVGGGCSQEYVITRTWTAVDDCGNSSSCTQTITVDDSMAPQITCPASLTIECNASTLPENTGTATATDNCDGTPTITSTDVTVGGGCPQEYIITRTWRATDDCGNSNTCTQTITVDDSMAPQIFCPISVTIACTASTLPDNTGSATATDNCDDTLTINSSDVIVAGSCPQEMIITRTWTATDDCGNSSSCTQVITVEDNVPPEITVCPADTIVNCTSPTDTASLGVIVAEDLCDETLSISYSDVTFPGLCPQERTILRTWVATDDCLNSSSCVQTIMVQDTTPPSITCPTDTIIDCTSLTDTTTLGVLIASDECDMAVTISFADVSVPGSCPQEYTLLRVWVATDDCLNTSTCIQTITVQDTIAPSIVCPPDATLECTESTDPNSTVPGSASATDNCEGPVSVTSNDVIVGGDCSQEYIIFRTWTATDECNNSSTCLQTITVDDSMAPQIFCPVSVTITCTASTLPDATGSATATDNCDDTLTINSSDVIVAGTCPQEMVITRTWTATDDCGNSSSCTQVITVEDNVPPEIIICPADTIVNCTSPTDTTTLGVLVAEDLCDEILAISYSDVSLPGSCPQERTILRTWVATDDCLNSSTCVQTIMVQDTTLPLFTCPSDTIVDCTSLTDTTTLGVMIATDDCDLAVAISFADISVPGSCPQEYTLLRVWTATDDCLNSSTCIQSITVQDTIGPSIVCPPDTTLECTASTGPNSSVPGSATATDNCEGLVSVTSTDVIVGGDCAQEYVILRTWTATDECDNSSTCLQTISIDDSLPPVLDCPDDLTLDCIAGGDYVGIILEWIEAVSATDNCSDSVTIVNNYDGVTIPNFSCTGGLVITFTATDECGNSSTCSITITKPCFELDTWVYLEGAAAHPNGFNTYTLPMRTTLNNLKVLPGQTLVDPFLGIKYTPPGQPYNIAPWNYFGTEGDGYDSGGDPMMGNAGYPSTVVDWVLVSLRNNANDQLNTASCQAAALLHKDGTVEFVEPLSCCNVNENTTYYVVIEHRNHLIVMSHVRVSWVNHKLTYDFRNKQSYVDDPFEFGIYARQKQIITGSFAMFGGNGNQIGNGDTDLNINDRSFWEGENGDVGEYRIGDYNLNGDTNLNDRVLWERNNGRFTSVPRN